MADEVARRRSPAFERLKRLFERREERTLSFGAAILGMVAVVVGTMRSLPESWLDACTAVVLGLSVFFALEFLLRLATVERRLDYLLSYYGCIDLVAALIVPFALAAGLLPAEERLLAMLWILKVVRYTPAFALIGRVLRNEGQSLLSVGAAFVIVLLLSATGEYLLERSVQPDVFGSIPDALWWAIVTQTTTGYGDVYPHTAAGRFLAGIVMVSGIGLFALWAGVLANGFARELRRQEFLRSWDLVARLPMFSRLGASIIAEVAHLLKAEDVPAGARIVSQGQVGDSMFFVADGEVEVRTSRGPVRLGPGEFFGEVALLSGRPRNATVVATRRCRLLRLDVADFRNLAASSPELLAVIEQHGAEQRPG